MIQVVEQTRDEKVAMYMKFTKRELAEMLLNNQEALARRLEPVDSLPGIDGTDLVSSNTPQQVGYTPDFNAGAFWGSGPTLPAWLRKW